MFKKSIFLSGLALFGGSSLLPAQEPAPAEPQLAEPIPGCKFWQATVGGGHYMVALAKIVSVSRHKYLLDAAMVVDEVTVDTGGQALARFYFISPPTDNAPVGAVKGVTNRAKELAEYATDRLAPGMKDMVMKKYPETTHAKSLEYRMLKESDLSALYLSLQYSFAKDVPGHYKSK